MGWSTSVAKLSPFFQKRSRSKGFWCSGALAMVMLFGPPVSSQENEIPGTAEDLRLVGEGEDRPVLTLSVKDCVYLALSNNPDIRAQALGLSISRTGIPEALGEYDPLAFFRVNQSKSENDTASSLQSAERGLTQLEMSLSQKVQTGATFRLAYSQNRTREFDTAFASQFRADPSQYFTDLTLSVTQPLFRGGGVAVNTSQIEIARNNEKISEHQFRTIVDTTIFQVYQAYWDLVFLFANYEVQRNSLQLARRQLSDTTARIDVGTLAPIEIHNSRASVAARLTDVQVASKLLRDGQDLLARLILPLPNLEAWNVEVKTKDRLQVLEPEGEKGEVLLVEEEEDASTRTRRIKEKFGIKEPERVAWVALAQEALDQRPEMIQSRIDLENRKITVGQTGNSKLPRVDLAGSWGLNALDRDWGQNLEDIRLAEFQENRSWSLGVTVEYPLGNRTLDARHRRSLIEERQAKLRYDNLTRTVISEVREAARGVETAWQTIFSTNEAAYRARKQLEAGNAKFDNGLLTSYDVLLLQNDLSTALANESRALTSYRIAKARTELSLGQLVDYPDVGVEINIRE